MHLVNVGLNNCGDLLMAMTAATKLMQRLGPRAVTVNGRECDPAGLRASAAAPASVLTRLTRLVSPRKSVEARAYRPGELVLDCNGYRHGGIWPDRNLIDDLDLAARVRDSGARLVLLPKSCGPFGTASGTLFGNLAAGANLLYLRDEESLRLCSPYTSRARLCPDFTIGMPAAARDGRERHGIVVVPNSKLVEAGMFSGIGSYARFLADCMRQLEGMGQPCSVLFHQSRDARELRRPLERHGIVTTFHDDSRAAKAALAKAWLVVSSRYHGALGALTSGTPCLVLGWSHKYAGMLRFYPRGEEWLVPEATPAALAARVAWMTAPGRRESVLADIATGNQGIAARTEAMWDEIAALESRR